uniref:Sulfotransferase domain-containing protein n=1 Tax=viral metagenome TaxID=1070528 RepID=A0A6C0D094_9ZZZZ
MTLKKFTIFGERCSGTNFLEELVFLNFDTELTWDYGFKHFFGFDSFEGSEDTLFICIVRHAFTWINSLRSNPHHLIPGMLKDTQTFLSHRVVSLDESGKLIRSDHHIETRKPYKNLYELRRVKNDFLIHRLPQLVKNYIFFRYEDLCDNFQSQMERLTHFLPRRQETDFKLFKQPTWYKKERNTTFVPKSYHHISIHEFYKNNQFDLLRDHEEFLYKDCNDRILVKFTS